MSTNNFVDDRAELGSEEEDEDFDEETGETRSRRNGANGRVEDSSDDEEDDDDEAEAAAIREGFIVDEEEDEDERAQRRREKRKRRRAEREEEEAALDEEDLDLIGEANPELEQKQKKSKFKRLKRGHRDERTPSGPRGVDEIFSEDEEEEILEPRGGQQDEFADFIEEDEFEDDVQRALEEEREVARPGKVVRGVAGIQDAGLDEGSAEDYKLAFGDGTEYDWALQKQDEQDYIEEGGDKQLELKDVFEPSQLIDRMLTDEDNEIRAKDVPERLQIARKPFPERDLTPEERTERVREEALWVSNMILPKKRLGRHFIEPFQAAVRKVLELMNIEDYEVPFIFQHRKDYLISTGPNGDDAQSPGENDGPERLLSQDDLWEIAELDLKFRGLLEKREALQTTYESLQKSISLKDGVFETMIVAAVSMEEIQDVQDYLHFQYSAQIKDLTVIQAETNGTQKRAQSQKTTFERIRASQVYNFVRGFGMSSDSFATNVLGSGPRVYTEDPAGYPEDVADASLDAPEFSDSAQVLRAGKAMFVEEIVLSPKMRKYVRAAFYSNGLIDCVRTDKGLRKIGEDHPYYAFKYLRAQDIPSMVRQPELYLRMLKAESEGLVEVKFRLSNLKSMRENMYQFIESDSESEATDAWNNLRREVVETAIARLERLIMKGVKETLKSECENHLARTCRGRYSEKLDQAPYKPKGMMLGTTPRVLALSNGRGVPGRDAICWAWVEDDGRILENGKFVDLRLGNPEKFLPDGKDVANLLELIKRRKPDVLAVSGFAVETRKLYKDLQEIVERNNLQGPEYENDETGETSAPLEVVMVNDEVARLSHTSDRAAKEFPQLPPLTRYCVALAKYLQSPIKEYASLGKNITSIMFDANQSLLPPEKLQRYLESAMVDVVNMMGVDIHAAVDDQYTANLLPYICGLGPRKATQMLKAININGGFVPSREQLLGAWDENGNSTTLPAVTPVVFANCSSFLYIEYDATEQEADYLDNTRIHPEDYQIARKMAADAMEMDEEDVKQEVDEGGPSAVIRRMVREKGEDKLNDLVLEEYAVQLERNFAQRKRATLETIRAELQGPYEELRRHFALLSSDDIFTMLTGETKDSLTEGMIIPVQIRRVFADHVEVKLDCGIEGGVGEADFPDGVGIHQGVEPRTAFTINSTAQAKVLFINRKQLNAQLSFREEALRRNYRKEYERLPAEWDDAQEAADKKSAQREREEVTGRAQRVVNHPLFFSYTHTQAEEYLGSKEPGEVVIRPSSKGLDHLAITWKIADNVYQHVDVLELDKENQFSLGKTLRVGGKYTYSDLDELIVNHVEAMSKKVTEIMKDDRYQKGSQASTEQWLKTYCEANPKRSMYAFFMDPKYPGYFRIAFKAGINANIGSWPIKIIPNAFEMRGHQYPDMNALKNGFKLLFTGDAGRRR